MLVGDECWENNKQVHWERERGGRQTGKHLKKASEPGPEAKGEPVLETGEVMGMRVFPAEKQLDQLCAGSLQSASVHMRRGQAVGPWVAWHWSQSMKEPWG